MVKRVGRFEVGKTIGVGTFSKVKHGIDTATDLPVAVKIVNKDQLENNKQMGIALKREIAIMKKLKHENLVELKEVLQTGNRIYIVLELVQGGELFDKIVENKHLTEQQSRHYFQQLIYGLYYCHQQGVAHRDLKPENILLDAADNLKISDFGLSNLQRKTDGNTTGTLLQTVCGTPNYAAPEVLSQQGYDGFRADIWSCGVILYVMLAGYLPFDDQHLNLLFLKIERGEYRMPPHISELAQDLLRKILVVNPDERILLPELLKHPWFQEGADTSKTATVKDCDKVEVTEEEATTAIAETEVVEAEPQAGTSAVCNIM